MKNYPTNINKKKNQLKYKLALINLLSDEKVYIHQVSIYPTEYPTEFDKTSISLTYSKKVSK